MKLVITVPKYFCCNRDCPHKTFAYAFDFIETNSIHTKRLNDYIYQLALKNSSINAKNQISFSHVPVSANTVLRILKKENIKIDYNAENIEIDDFAFLKRNVYYSVIVDNHIKIADISTVPLHKKEYLSKRERRKVETGTRKWEIVRKAHQLKEEGNNNSKIARLLGMARPTVIKYLKITKPPIDARPCIRDPFIPRIKELLLDGLHYTEIFQLIKEEGYPRQISLYNRKMKEIRHKFKHNIRYFRV
ncbi:hypothetical protein SAMN05661086_01192 [Anaeromicropila populeti]|uniref:Helix-turn-helix domain of resolvase n=1 Tax=Anaeromicropila populeti TaxID=37658 RepID=A0A1I6IWL0_9FIRM|nr:hypothetical protein SAMN05661086_01192 [Anaeromicropila populeti]